ncbi:haloacid dehalogenase type II [Kineococcus rhizosphaerae]|uniref:2-haloacid dehalogenase n=1 Tax=Kineococcus rhizosphaerae TaxID=559628 RepID=A0A2T0QZK8_9ACTN|nr:haloacid dehalogenase type II [Kineococcus rhizosphaerae]PRY12113.1 2-haloacid dehalogenase [Kineococcus rhizosphaerae]
MNPSPNPPVNPSVVVFDVNETLSDLRPLADRFVAVGAPAHLAPLWFATVLRDGFALAAVGDARPFAQLGAEALRSLLPGAGVEATDDAVQHVLDGVGRLPLHPDVADGVRGLRADGHRLFTLSNGSAEVGERLLTAGGVRGQFEAVLSVEAAGVWKPARAAYRYAARVAGAAPEDVLLVAVHPWDVDGAARAGLRTAWIDRSGVPYPASATRPDVRATDLADLCAQLAG